MSKGFFAYPSYPEQIGETIQAAIQELRQYHAFEDIADWRELDIPGHFIAHEVLHSIDASDFLVADITALNFNVTYEVGYAIGSGKRVLIVRNEAYAKAEDERIRKLGIFDSLGFAPYENSKTLAALVRSVRDLDPRPIGAQQSKASPIYVTKTRYRSDYAIRLLARLKKTGFAFRSFDPTEQPRLSALEAIREVSESYGVLVHLVPSAVDEAWANNLRGAFIAGLSAGMGRVTKIIQEGNEPIPLDYRDLATPITHPSQIDTAIADFAGEVNLRIVGKTDDEIEAQQSFLEKVSLGASSAENEIGELAAYYLPTDDFRRALRGEARLIVGRKGSGKSAVFFRVRDKISSSRRNVVLALKPDGYQLVKLKERILSVLDKGSAEHTVTAFWQCVLLLEIAKASLEKDRLNYKQDDEIYASYKYLDEKFKAYGYDVEQGDFAERISGLVYRIEGRFDSMSLGADGLISLSSPQVTKLIYDEDVTSLRRALVDYLKARDGLWVLFDNIDKGWTPTGIDSSDVLILRSLLEASRKLERAFQGDHIEAHTLIFLRNDVYELLLDSMADRGKEQRVLVDWRDPDALRELVRLRITSSIDDDNTSFDHLWAKIAVRHVDGEETFHYLLERCLMRPRYLLDLLNQVRGVALTLSHERITDTDVKKGIEFFSSDVVQDTDLELRDIFPNQSGILYAFIGAKSHLSDEDARIQLVVAGISEDAYEQVRHLLLWYGFFGVLDEAHEPRYIYNMQYNLKIYDAYAKKRLSEGSPLVINPAFWSALDIKVKL